LILTILFHSIIVENLKAMQYPYLISRALDPVFAVSIGVASYYLYEQRTGRPEGHHLNELVMRKYQSWVKSEK